MPDLFHMRPELLSSEQARQKLGKKKTPVLRTQALWVGRARIPEEHYVRP